jgi:cell wall-associated NlpC family hydrolase
VEWIQAHPRQLREVDVMQPGDVLGIRIGRAVHHAGIVLDERLFGHVMRGYRTTRTHLRMIPRYGKLEHIWRPLK